MNSFLKTLKTTQIVALYNLANPEAPIQRFQDRSTAELRMSRVMQVDPAYFYRHLAKPAADIGIILPATMVPLTASKPTPAASKPTPAASTPTPAASTPTPAASKQSTPPHLNLRCPSCGYYAKTTPQWLAQGRLICPVDVRHGKLLTADERGEKRGR